MRSKHKFVICAYKESPYLEACIRSLLAQKEKSPVWIVTSTPNDHICKLAEQYGLPLFLNKQKSSLAGDWNFAFEISDSELVTIVHQDDLYSKHYLSIIKKYYRTSHRPLILFTNYLEIKKGHLVRSNRNLFIKRLMLWPLKYRIFQNNILIRRRILSLGNPISCPSVTYVKDSLKDFAFHNNMGSNIDWQAWAEISERRGSFVYIDTPAICHRIHAGSTTSEMIGEKKRWSEDYYMFSKFWPGKIARLLSVVYRLSEKNNEVSDE